MERKDRNRNVRELVKCHTRKAVAAFHFISVFIFSVTKSRELRFTLGTVLIKSEFKAIKFMGEWRFYNTREGCAVYQGGGLNFKCT
jgi:hypothetical protein